MKYFLRLGLHCIVSNPKLKFRRLYQCAAKKMRRKKRMAKISSISTKNVDTMYKVVQELVKRRIGAYGIYHPILPLYTDPTYGYSIKDLPEADYIFGMLSKIKKYCRQHQLRLNAHPDQFVVLTAKKDSKVEQAVRELNYYGTMSKLLGIDSITLHVGGVYGDKAQAVTRLKTVVKGLPDSVRKRLTFENDDRSYSPKDVIAICDELQLPFTYDVHHHRCKQDLSLIHI